MSDLFECLSCGVAQPTHMYHQKNAKRGRHKYCKECRRDEKAKMMMGRREARAAASAILNENWVFTRPLLVTDFRKGESLADMKKRLGINLADFRSNQ